MTLKQALIIFISGFFLVLLAPEISLAYVVAEQPDTFTQISVNTGDVKLGTGLSGQFSSMDVTLQPNTNVGTADIVYRLTCFVDGTYSSECGGGTNGETQYIKPSQTLDGVKKVYTLSQVYSGNPVTFDATKYYTFQATGVSSFYRFGTTTGTASENYIIRVNPNYTTDGVTQIITPLYASVHDANNLNFQFQYNVIDLQYQYAGFYLTDLTSGQNIDTTSLELLINADGISTYSNSIDLINGHQYQWQPYLRSTSTSTQPAVGVTTFFFAGTNQSRYVPPAPSNPFATSTVFLNSNAFQATTTNATTTLDTTGILPDSTDSILRRKFPTSYLYDARNILSELSTGQGSVADVTYTFPVGVGSTTNTITLLHNASIQLLSPVSAIKGIEKDVLYVLTGLYSITTIASSI